MYKKQNTRNIPERILIIGLGYVGFPLLIESCKAGYRVYGLDNDAKKIKGYIDGNSTEEFYQEKTVKSMLTSGMVSFHSSTLELESNFDIIVICVPTPLEVSDKPDLSYIESAMQCVIRVYRKETLVILESSSYPGTTRNLIHDKLKRNFFDSQSSEEILVAYSPERIDPGSIEWNLNNTPKLVSGINKMSLQKAINFYEKFVNTLVTVDLVENAELAKLFENTFRLVNISLINEFINELKFLNCDPHLALDAAYTKPFGIMQFKPSPGIGGHCIPIDPVYLLDWARSLGANLSIVEAANLFAKSQHKRNLALVEKAMGGDLKAKKILIVGVSYKPNVTDTRESPAFKLMNALALLGAQVHWYDPIALSEQSSRLGNIENWNGDLIVLVTKHSIFDPENLAALAQDFIDLNTN